MAGTNIIYSPSYYKTTDNKSMIGKIDTPIKMIIEHESDACAKKHGVQKTLFNIEKSNKFGETIIGNSEFDVFRAAEEGKGASADIVYETHKKFIEHIQFMKEFVITAAMIEDSNHGVASNAKLRAENFVRAYYKTMNKICSFTLINGTSSSATFGGTTLDLSVYDEATAGSASSQPLFSKTHSHIKKNVVQADGTLGNGPATVQSNLFAPSAAITDKASLSLYMNMLSAQLRGFKDSQDEPLEYTADTIILPGNHPQYEQWFKQICGSEREAGSANNDINVNYGNWTIVVLPDWNPESPEFMLMSSEANKNLAGNMFFNRIPLTITPWMDNHTGNYIWTGRCRFGIGFGSWKHILRASIKPNAERTTITLPTETATEE